MLSQFERFDRDLAGEQIRDFVIGKPGFAQDLAGMLAQSRRRPAQRAVRLAEPHRWPDNSNAPLGRMVGPREHFDSGKMLVVRQSAERVDRS